jgi:hypothetical protein
MIALQSNAVREGYIRGSLSMGRVREVISEGRNFEAALAMSGKEATPPYHCSRVAAGTLVGFIPCRNYPCDILVARLPFAQQMVPAVSLRPMVEDWEADLHLLSKDHLLRHEGVIIKADWVTYLVDLAATLQKEATHLLGVDKTLLAIGKAWERWERENMTWPARCQDLARLTRLQAIDTNTLMQKCKRHGLVRRDKKGFPASGTRRGGAVNLASSVNYPIQ